jgi:hypothetical protein
VKDDLVTLGGDGTWACTHRTTEGTRAPSTVLRADDAREEYPRLRGMDRPRCVVCPDCGTYWRVWRSANAVRPYFEPLTEPRPLFRAPERDIDVILTLVRQAVPEATVTQLRQSQPDDDDAMWLFEMPNETRTIQIDGVERYGQCPFYIEHSGMMHVADREKLVDPRVVAQKIVDYLLKLRR